MKKYLLILAFLAGCGSSSIEEEIGKFEVDSEERVINIELKSVPCPTNAVIFFIAGQSNAANHSIGTASTSTKTFQHWNGKCYPLKSPMLGATGKDTNAFQQVLVDYSNKTGKPVIAHFYALGGRSIEVFAPGGEHFNKFRLEYQSLEYVDYFLWQQGETDAYFQMSSETYLKHWGAMLREIGIYNPKVARSTICADYNSYNNEIGYALDYLRSIHGGPNTDNISKAIRFDGCHFGPDLTSFSILWNETL